MRARVHRWGNSLAVRIPKALAQEVRLDEGTPIEIAIADGQLVLTPIVEPGPTLEQLLAGVSDDNLHGELDTGPSVGRELW